MNCAKLHLSDKLESTFVLKLHQTNGAVSSTFIIKLKKKLVELVFVKIQFSMKTNASSKFHFSEKNKPKSLWQLR